MAVKVPPHAVVTTQSKPGTVIAQGVSVPDVSKPTPSYVTATMHSSTAQSAQLINRIGDI